MEQRELGYLALAAAAVFLPSIIGAFRALPTRNALIAFNLCAPTVWLFVPQGFGLFGAFAMFAFWIIALIWSLWPKARPATAKIDPPKSPPLSLR